MKCLEKYYIIGAKQKNQILKDWEQYQNGLIIKVSPENKTAVKCVEYTSPPEVCPKENPSISFTAGTMYNNHLYVGTQTEVLIYSLPQFKIVNSLSIPSFNDIHHVRPTEEGNLMIVNTGLDMVIELSPNGKVLKEWDVLGGDPWTIFSRTTDYRKVPTTKPHQSHPNYVFEIGGDIWATRCLQKDAVCLTKLNKTINIGHQLIHDGVVFGNSIYFTQVDGHVVVVDIHSLQVKYQYNLNNMNDSKIPLGWCRGIKIINQDQVIVGFTRIRPVKKTEADGTISWEGGYGVLPTRIACFDLKKGKQLWEQQVEEYGMNAIYSIHSENESDI